MSMAQLARLLIESGNGDVLVKISKKKKRKKCKKCKGSGAVEDVLCSFITLGLDRSQVVTCGKCNGRGKVDR